MMLLRGAFLGGQLIALVVWTVLMMAVIKTLIFRTRISDNAVFVLTMLLIVVLPGVAMLFSFQWWWPQ